MGRFATFNLFVAFAFTVMADPVSSVAYAIEAALVELDGDLGSLLPAMVLVVGTIAVVSATYTQLIARFPGGGGGAEAVAAAFGEGWAFLPLAALLVDFALTTAISTTAGVSALIAWIPALADGRVLLALALSLLVAVGVLFGHRGRVLFATAALLFVATALVVIVRGAGVASAAGDPAGAPLLADASLVPVLLAMPLGMALATGVEAPSNAIAQLGQLGAGARRLFGQLTIWLMVAIVGALTLALAALAVKLGVGLPGPDTTLLAEVARGSTGDGVVFAAFQAFSMLLLLAASASSFLAASGLLKALALHGGPGAGLVPRRFGEVNRFYVPPWGVLAVLVVSATLVLAAGGDERALVGFYAVAVFISFVAALCGAARLSIRDRRPGQTLINVAGLLLVGFVLALNLARTDGAIALGATVLVGLTLRKVWIRRGRPGGIAAASREALPSP